MLFKYNEIDFNIDERNVSKEKSIELVGKVTECKYLDIFEIVVDSDHNEIFAEIYIPTEDEIFRHPLLDKFLKEYVEELDYDSYYESDEDLGCLDCVIVNF